jgi:3-phenylpropionate/cinnamic acid dioxygenase small subunit
MTVAAIIDTLNLYAIAVDSRHWHLFDAIFMPEARFDYFGRRWDGLAAFRDDFAAAHEGFTATQHFVGNHVVRFDTEGATALSYCRWTLERDGTPGGDLYSGTAWYDDRLVGTGTEWRISNRTCGIIHAQGNPAVAGATTLPPRAPLHAAARDGLLRIPGGDRAWTN